MANLIIFKKYIYKIKKFYIILLLFIIIKNIFQIIIKEKFIMIGKNDFLNKYITLKKRPKYSNDPLFVKEKISILSLISECVGKNITSVDSIFLSINCNFGNCQVILNKFLFYCEIIGCKEIILNEKIFWYIKNKFIIKKYNISIKAGERIKFNNSSSLYFDCNTPFDSFFYIKPEIRINFIRSEIIRNLNKINVDKEDLYIHIRSGDIFNHPQSPYAQPPFCFYRKILNNHKFNNIYLISQDKNNPIVEKILNEYSHIIYRQNSLKDDISYLTNAYNIVASISSFLISIIQLNYNLENLFDYNLYKIREKILFYHYDLLQFPHNNFIKLFKKSKFELQLFKFIIEFFL